MIKKFHHNADIHRDNLLASHASFVLIIFYIGNRIRINGMTKYKYIIVGAYEMWNNSNDR